MESSADIKEDEKESEKRVKGMNTVKGEEARKLRRDKPEEQMGERVNEK